MENYSPAFPAAPLQSSSELGILLGSFPTDPAHFCQHSSQSRRAQDTVADPSHFLTTAIRSTQEYSSSVHPSLFQQAALAVLQEFDNQIVLAWLTGLRSFRPNRNHWFQPGSLSSKHSDAIAVLKDCPDTLVCAWLDFTRAGGPYPLLRSAVTMS